MFTIAKREYTAEAGEQAVSQYAARRWRVGVGWETRWVNASPAAWQVNACMAFAALQCDAAIAGLFQCIEISCNRWQRHFETWKLTQCASLAGLQCMWRVF